MNGFGFQAEPQQLAGASQAVGNALLQRRLARQPQNAAPGFPVQQGNTMRGLLPQVGKRLLQASPSDMPTPPNASNYGGFP